MEVLVTSQHLLSVFSHSWQESNNFAVPAVLYRIMTNHSNLLQGPTPYCNDNRDFGHFSDHVSVWIDKYIGVDNEYSMLKAKFNDNVQVLQTNNTNEMEADDDTMLCANQDMLKKLSDEVYCLKYFCTTERALDYIHNNSQRKIFFISSGTIGQEIVPLIAELPQIQGIYIFCGNISKHAEWARDYIDKISAMLEHQDDLLQRLTRDIADYVEQKGDQHNANGDKVQARNCYSWSKKLLIH